MKIMYDHQIFASQSFGGISRYFFEIIKRISKDNQTYLFQGLHVNEYNLSEIDTLYSDCSFKIPKLYKFYRLMKYVNTVGFGLYNLNRNTDIYHPTYYGSYSTNSKKCVVTVYDMIHEIYLEEFRDKTAERKAKLINKADGVIAISESTKNDLIDVLGISPEKIQVIYLANSLHHMVTTRRIVQEPYFLLVGHGSGYKNFTDFITAFGQSSFRNELKCVVFGGLDFNMQEKSLMKKLGIEKNIIYKRGDDSLLANLYKYAELFVYPSKYEGFGLPPLEAMYYGTPVLASNTSSIPEVVGDAGMYFNPNSIDDMADKLDYALNNKKRLLEYGQKGVLREKMFSWDKCARETVDYYSKVLNEVK